MKNVIYMKVTRDKYEFPIEMADSVDELAQKLGTTKGNIRVTMSNAKRKGWRSPYVRVEIEDDEE